MRINCKKPLKIVEYKIFFYKNELEVVIDKYVQKLIALLLINIKTWFLQRLCKKQISIKLLKNFLNKVWSFDFIELFIVGKKVFIR